MIKSLADLLFERSHRRSDGDRVPNIHPYRRLMAHIMRGRNESAVYFDTFAKADRLLQFIEEANRSYHVDFTHCLVAAGSIGLAENINLNRFIVGRRLYQRNGIWITFSLKRKKLGRKAKVSVIKLEITEDMTFRQLCTRINKQINLERSDTKTGLDKELNFLNVLPRSVLDVSVAALRGLDHFNLLPHSFIKGDGMYTSMFIANVGSFDMTAGYHHLYEWGTCPLFMMVGKMETRPIVVGDEIEAKKVIPIKWSMDERIEDGLNAKHGMDSVNRALESPYEYFGCLSDDEGDDKPLIQPPR